MPLGFGTFFSSGKSLSWFFVPFLIVVIIVLDNYKTKNTQMKCVNCVSENYAKKLYSKYIVEKKYSVKDLEG